MVDTRSNMQLADLKSKPRGGKGIINIIDCGIVDLFYPRPGPVHYKLIFLEKIHGPYHINCDQKNKS